MRLHIKCPNCGKPAVSFRTRQLSDLVTEISYNCRNAVCGASFVFVGEVHRWLRLPTQLNPRINVPLSPIIQRRLLVHALQTLHTAELPPEGEIVNSESAQIDIFDNASPAEAPPHGP